MRMRQQRRELIDLAARIVHRQRRGQFDIAAELVMRALATSNADQTFALALALTEQALYAVEKDRLDAAERNLQWRPAMMDEGELVTPDSIAVSPVPLAMRMIEAMHQSMAGEPDAVTRIGEVYEEATAAEDWVFHGLFAALAAYTAYAMNDETSRMEAHGAGCTHGTSG